jgi:hypothetical protein
VHVLPIHFLVLWRRGATRILCHVDEGYSHQCWRFVPVRQLADHCRYVPLMYPAGSIYCTERWMFGTLLGPARPLPFGWL